MKTILYNPIFINPQVYYVFPRLTRYLQPDNESTAEPANYIGTIEVKVIAYGDTTLKRTYTNTDSIDLSEFKNTWIRISLFTKVGSCVLGEWKIGNMESDLPYIDPEVLASLKAVVIVGNKTNNDSDRAIVKNLVDPDNPFVISNAAYTEGSGYADKDSPYYGAFVTDGIDDLITSTKTVQEMLGGSNEITVVSMAHFIKGESNAPEICRINQIRRDTRSIRDSIFKIGKSGIFGYTYKNGVTTINNILGDKNDCIAEGNLDGIVAPFSVEGYYYNNNSNPLELCSIAWYWTIIANKVLITDQINQVIAYFNLDRTLKPDILCNVKKQGITNENHAEFGDRLIDFSGNGRYIQLNNIAWKGDSGIGKYEVDFASLNYNNTTSVFTATYKSCSISKIIKDGVGNIFYNWGQTLAAINSTKIQVIGLDEIGAILEFTYLDESGNSTTKQYSTDGIYDLPASAAYQGDSHNTNFRFSIRGYIGDCDITITQIPSNAGALCLDGVNDFGKVTGMPVYKDYTFIADRYINNNVGSVASKSVDSNQYGAFIFEIGRVNYSFNVNSTVATNLNKDRTISYLSKYSYNGENVNVGNEEDSNSLWIGAIRDNDTRFSNMAIYSLMSFPYSMSEFLIERQLKKHKLGTLYPDMVEFRPIVKSNSEYQVVNCYIDTLPAVVGNYYPINSKLRIAVTTKGAADEVTSLTVNGVSLGTPSVNGNRFTFNGTLSDKSPQKINITIDEYIRFEDIVQPYPVLLRFKDENGNEVSWGGKFKVGSTITRIGSAADSNLLPNIYNIFGLLLNGDQVTSSKVIVEKTMVFKAKSTYIFDNNEPKCVLSPSRLRIPNSSYKLLGYIPDISGHGNHGKINNSAYAGMSGVNGYPVVFGANETWENLSSVYSYTSDVTSTTIHITRVKNAGTGLLFSYVKKDGALTNIREIPAFRVTVKGLEGNSKFGYRYLATEDATVETLVYLGNGTHELSKSFTPTEALLDLTRNAWVGIFITPMVEGEVVFDCDITIEVLPEYEGAYCLDGVDDFVTIPTTVGGKQVLMKVNWDSSNSALLYDQRGYNNEFAIYNGSADSDGNPIPAYQGRNNGQTYIDGILNSNIKASELRAITHNITITNELSAGVNKFSPVIGSNRVHNAYFTNMALYDFMLFDNISTDDKIKQLNEYVGMEGNTEWRKTK